MMNKEILKAPWKGELKIGEVNLPCYVLEDGRRVLSQRGMLKALGMTSSGGSAKGVHRLVQFTGGNILKPFISKELTVRTQSPIAFRAPHGGKPTYGYEATILAEICEIILAAHDAGVLLKQQLHIAERAKILFRGFGIVGIIALVDEATGYQEFRARHALEEILEKFIAKELRPWAKTFPDEFYEQMFRLRGWRYDPASVKRPGVIGHLTNDIVYSRLAPGVLEELRAKEPKDHKGRRKHHLHRWTTADIGHPKLREHLASVITLMKVAPDKAWRKFMDMLNRALPKFGDTLSLDLDESDED